MTKLENSYTRGLVPKHCNHGVNQWHEQGVFWCKKCKRTYAV